MKNFIHGMLVVLVMASAALLSAQTPVAPQTAVSALTADEIVGKYVAAIGGKEAISQVKSLYMESSVSMMGAENPSTTTIVNGVGYKNETNFNGTQIVQCYTDKGGWTINPMAGATTATPMPDDVYNTGKSQINIGGPLYNYAANGGKVELIAKDASGYKIKLTTKENIESVLVIDPTSYHLTSMTAKGKMQDQDVDITTTFSDYRKTDLGYVVPYGIDVNLGGQFDLTIAVKKLELNKTIDPAVFAMPK